MTRPLEVGDRVVGTHPTTRTMDGRVAAAGELAGEWHLVIALPDGNLTAANLTAALPARLFARLSQENV